MTAYNPIARAEINHHIRSTSRRIRWHHRIARGFTVLATAIALEVTAIVLFSAVTGIDRLDVLTPSPGRPSGIGILLYLLPLFVLLPVTLVFALRTWIHTLVLASQTIVREKQSGTWDLLLLTGISPRRLLIGKWWGVVSGLGQDYAILVMMRVGLTFFVMIEGTRFSQYFRNGNWYINSYHYSKQPQFPELLLTIAAIALFTCMGVCLTAAIGVLASLLLRRGAFTLVLSLVMGIALPLLFAALPVIIGAVAFNGVPTPERQRGTSIWTLSNFAIYSGFSQIDNGTVIAGTLTADADTIEQWWVGMGHQTIFMSYHPYRLYLASVIAAIAIQALLLYLLLLVAQRVARYQGALPPKRA